MLSDKYFTRMGDGEGVWMSKEQIREEVLTGMEDAVVKGKAQPMSGSDVDYLIEILTMPEKNVSVERGQEGITTFDAGTLKMAVRSGIPIDSSTALLIHERVLCSDTMEICNTDYSYKQVKNIVSEEAMAIQRAQMNCIMPIFYGAMPNMGLYIQSLTDLWTTGLNCCRRGRSWRQWKRRNRPHSFVQTTWFISVPSWLKPVLAVFSSIRQEQAETQTCWRLCRHQKYYHRNILI